MLEENKGKYNGTIEFNNKDIKNISKEEMLKMKLF